MLMRSKILLCAIISTFIAGQAFAGYVGNDPINFTDPSGMARVCNGNENCVDVDGNGDGDVSDDDLTSDQISAFGEHFSDFIDNNNGRNLSGDGKPIDNSEGLLSADNENTLRTASQFVGASLKDAGHGKAWRNVSRIVVSSSFKGGRVNGAAFVSAEQEGYFGTDSIRFPGVSPILEMTTNQFYSSPSDIARVLIHETGHSARLFGYTPIPTNHFTVDRWARGHLMQSGLGGGGCVRMNVHFPGC